MLLSFNEDNWQLLEMVLTKETNKDYTKFMNFLMSEVYNAIFQKKLPRVLPEMKNILQLSTEKRIRDWFLFQQGTVIRFYGFVHQSYLLHAFLTPRVFSMDLIRKKLIVEIEHFLNFKKSTEIRYPWDVGSFIIKNKSALPMIEILLNEMGFLIESSINYDPHHVISNRRHAMKRKHFEHDEVVG